MASFTWHPSLFTPKTPLSPTGCGIPPLTHPILLLPTATSYTYTDQAGDSTVNWATEAITFRVRAVGVGQSAYSASPVTATATFPNTGSVTNLAVTSTTTAVNFTFDQSGITAYNILYRKQGATPGDYGAWMNYITTDQGDIEFTDPTITASIPLSYLAWTGGIQLAAQAGPGTGGPITNVVSVTLPAVGLDAPTLTASADTLHSQFDLSWTSAGDDEEHPVTYTILDMTPADDNYTGPHLVTTTTDTSAVISIPELGGYYAILATDDQGNIAMSNTVDLAIVKAPSGLTAAVVKDGISLEWNNIAYNEDSFVLERFIHPTPTSTTWTLDPDWTAPSLSADFVSYVDTTAVDGTTYQYQVAAAKDSVKSAPTTTTVTTKPTVKLEIIWEGDNITESELDPTTGLPIVWHTGDDITGKTIDFLAGQRIKLSMRMVIGGGTYAWGGAWNLGGGGPGNYDYVKGFTVVPNKTGKLETLTNDDLNNGDITFYGVVDAPGHTFTATAPGGFTASTTFNIKKPGHSDYSGTFTTTAAQGTPTYDAATEIVKDIIVFARSVPAGEQVFYVQRANINIHGHTFSGREINSALNTNGEFQLDTYYPYPDTFGGDIPSFAFTKAYASVTGQYSFEDWLMWQAPGPSIPVPLLSWTWSWSASASWVGGVATLSATSPTAVQIKNGSLTDTYPTWDKVLPTP